jgi:cyclophilin family peptidyl-prolyl cis-trans isomerase
MSILLETSLGDLVIDLFHEQCPKTCFNFIRLCMLKKLNGRLFISVQKDYLATVSDEPSVGIDESVYQQKYFGDEITKRKFTKKGLVAMANTGPNLNASNFFITLGDERIDSLYKKHTIFG